jgi:single-stranded-DNA-specific exonuclease
MTKFVLRENPPENLNEAFASLSDFVKRHLFHINIKDKAEVEAFISPDFDKHTHDPFLLKDMDKAVTRIFQAINSDEKICIYSDYDADGVPAAVVLHDFFKKIGFNNFINYIPHRNKEGFGINAGAIDSLIEQEVKLIISVDCGIADIEPVKKAKEAGVDVIITDHHEVPGDLPPAFAIVDPKQDDCHYPEKMLCGSGVAFKLVQAMLTRGREFFEKEKVGDMSENTYLKNIANIPVGWEKWLLDMVGIATLSDMVPLVGENRVLAKYGLVVLRKSPRVGLVRLLKDARLNQRLLNEDDVGFSISPKINAASRMGEPEIAFKLLSTTSPIEADVAVKHLTKINNERKGAVAAISKDIHKVLEKHFEEMGENLVMPKVIVRGNPNWSPSLLGLVANNVMDKYNVPVFLWGKGESSEFKGSCRSNGALNVVEVMKEVPSDIVTNFGGHEMAGGFVISEKGVFDFEKVLEEAAEKVAHEKMAEKVLTVDGILKVDDLDSNFFKILEGLAPFGVANEKPIFLIQDTEYDRHEMFGKAKEHLKIIFKNSRGREVPAIKFFDNGKMADKISGSKKITIAVIPEESYFMNKKEFRMRVVEVL